MSTHVLECRPRSREDSETRQLALAHPSRPQRASARPAPLRDAAVACPARLGLISRIRAEIAAGSYDNPWRIDVAVERMLERLSDGA